MRLLKLISDRLIWILPRIINLPIGFNNETTVARKIGNNLGVFLEMDKKKSDTSWGNSIQIRVKLDISKPLRRGFMLRTEGISEARWITIRYERIPDFCFQRGVIGHVAKECTGKGNKEEEHKIDFEFGMWMKFKGLSRLEKNTEQTRKNEKETRNEDQHEVNEDGKVGRREEGINVDLNQVSPMGEEYVETRTNGNEALRYDHIEAFLGYESLENRWKKLQNIRDETTPESLNRSTAEKEGSQTESVASLRKEKTWKRRKRPSQSKGSLMDVSKTRKRKGLTDGSIQNKKLKQKEGEENEVAGNEQDLAVAVSQSCLGL